MAERILIIDDDAAMASMLADLLAHEGFSVSAVTSPVEGSSLARAGGVDLVLSDVHMLPVDGFGVLREIRSRGDTPPVILMSAFPGPETAERALAEGADAFLSKPFSPEVLGEAVGRVLSARSTSPE